MPRLHSLQVSGLSPLTEHSVTMSLYTYIERYNATQIILHRQTDHKITRDMCITNDCLNSGGLPTPIPTQPFISCNMIDC